MSRNAFSSWTMSDAFAEAVKSEPRAWSCDAPFGFDCLDAPYAIPSGSVESYKFETIPGKFAPIQTYSMRYT